jgi:hypothetical protein
VRRACAFSEMLARHILEHYFADSVSFRVSLARYLTLLGRQTVRRTSPRRASGMD